MLPTWRHAFINNVAIEVRATPKPAIKAKAINSSIIIFSTAAIF